MRPKVENSNYLSSGRFRKGSGRVAGRLLRVFLLCCSSGRFRKVSGRVAGRLFRFLSVMLQFRKVPEGFRKGCRKVVSSSDFGAVPEGSGRIPEAISEGVVDPSGTNNSP